MRYFLLDSVNRLGMVFRSFRQSQRNHLEHDCDPSELIEGDFIYTCRRLSPPGFPKSSQVISSVASLTFDSNRLRSNNILENRSLSGESKSCEETAKSNRILKATGKHECLSLSLPVITNPKFTSTR